MQEQQITPTTSPKFSDPDDLAVHSTASPTGPSALKVIGIGKTTPRTEQADVFKTTPDQS